MTPSFKNASGQLYTKRLFFEQAYDVNDKTPCIYTLKDEDFTLDDKTYVSLYPHYLRMEDLTEYRFATTFFESYEHFSLLCNCSWFKPHIERWRKELRLKIRQNAIENIRAVARDEGSKNFFEANKMILSGMLEEKKGTSRGRPSKDEVSESVKEMAREDYSISKDYDRLIGTQ